MSVTKHYHDAVAALRDPALKVLSGPSAPWTMALLRHVFTGLDDIVEADEAYRVLDSAIPTLRTLGAEIPDWPVEMLCNEWVRQRRYLTRSLDDGKLYFRLTSQAQNALVYAVSFQGQDRRLVSEARIKTLVTALELAAERANPDRESRLRQLEQQRVSIDREIAGLESGAEMSVASDDAMLEALANVLNQIESLPSDFLFVAERLDELRHRMRSDASDEPETRRELLVRYRANRDEVLRESAAGRAYLGALELLVSREMSERVRESIAVVLRHPFVARADSRSLEQLKHLWDTIHRGTESVRIERNRVAAAVTARVAEYEAIRFRELSDLLAQARAAAGDALTRSAMPKARDLDLTHERIQLKASVKYVADWLPKTLQMTDYVHVDDGERMSPGLLRELGGPHFTAIDAAIAGARASGPVTLAAVFERLPEESRRAADLVGIIHKAARADPVGHETVTARQANGEHARYRVPRLVFEEAQID